MTVTENSGVLFAANPEHDQQAEAHAHGKIMGDVE